MPVIALIGNKGGAGKTTLCVNLAVALAENQPLVIVDADPQQSSLQWHAIAKPDRYPNLEVIGANKHLAQQLSKIKSGGNWCLVDCPPSAQSPQMQQALRHADLAIVPVLPSPLDIWASVQLEHEFDTARQKNPALALLLVINQFESRTRLSRSMQRALAELELPTAKTFLKRRAIYRHSLMEGRSVHDVGIKGRDASEELRQLIKEMQRYL